MFAIYSSVKVPWNIVFLAKTILSGTRSGGTNDAQTHMVLSKLVVILMIKVKPGIQIMRRYR